MPNLISELIHKYFNSVYYIEYKGFNVEYTETENGISDAICTHCTDADNGTCISCIRRVNSGKKIFGTDCQHLLYKTDNIFVSIGYHFMHNGILIAIQFITLLFS